MGIAEIIGTLLSIVGKVMDRMPNYEQKKKEKFHSLKADYYEELHKIPKERDDNRVTTLFNELLLFIDSFSKEL